MVLLDITYAISPMLLAAIPGLVGAASKYYTGVQQGKKAENIARSHQRPDYVTPNEVMQNAALSAFLAANGRLPGYGAMENRLASSQARTLGGAIESQRDPSSIAAVLAASQRNYDDSQNDLAMRGLQYRDQNMMRAMQQRQNVAAYRDKEWDWNKRSRYLSAMAAASALRNAAGMNKANALNDVTTMSTAALGSLGNPAAGGGATQRMAAGQMLSPNNIPSRDAARQFPSQSMVDYGNLWQSPDMGEYSLYQYNGTPTMMPRIPNENFR